MKKPFNLNEDLLHFLWQYRMFDQSNLVTTQQNAIRILQTGQHNHNAGPDFQNVRIEIDGVQWAGHAEIHVKASDWYLHQHEKDASYNNTILHVVYVADAEVLRPDGTVIPTLELRSLIDHQLLERYKYLRETKDWIPCAKLFHTCEKLVVEQWLGRLAVERLQYKIAPILRLLEETKNSWEQTFYMMLALNFGFKVNNEAFEQLARSLPLGVLGKHKNNLLQVEALLFGQAGLLDKKTSLKDIYFDELQKEYRHLKTKFTLTPIPESIWKFMRTRPVNFPTIRIAQFAQLVVQSTHLFSKILEEENPKNLGELFDVTPSDYWHSHYRFGTASAPVSKKMGRLAIENIITNTIAPMLFAYGQHKNEYTFCERAIELLELLPPEENKVIRSWKEIGLTPVNGAQSQAMLLLKTVYCDAKKCLQCAVGNQVMSGYK
jgi:hypothetical protein